MSKTAKVLDFPCYKLHPRNRLNGLENVLRFQFSLRGDIPVNHFKSLSKARGSSVLCSFSDCSDLKCFVFPSIIFKPDSVSQL